MSIINRLLRYSVGRAIIEHHLFCNYHLERYYNYMYNVTHRMKIGRMSATLLQITP